MASAYQKKKISNWVGSFIVDASNSFIDETNHGNESGATTLAWLFISAIRSLRKSERSLTKLNSEESNENNTQR